MSHGLQSDPKLYRIRGQELPFLLGHPRAQLNANLLTEPPSCQRTHRTDRQMVKSCTLKALSQTVALQPSLCDCPVSPAVVANAGGSSRQSCRHASLNVHAAAWEALHVRRAGFPPLKSKQSQTFAVCSWISVKPLTFRGGRCRRGRAKVSCLRNPDYL